MGRPRKSAEDHVKNGTYRPSRHGPLPSADAAGDRAGEVVARPDSLTGRAAELWDELAGLLGGVLRRRDIPAMIELCRWVERSERIAATLDKLAPTDPTFKNLLISAGIATDKVAVLSGRFGLSPADRARIRADVSAPQVPRVATRPRQFRGEDGPPKSQG